MSASDIKFMKTVAEVMALLSKEGVTLSHLQAVIDNPERRAEVAVALGATPPNSFLEIDLEILTDEQLVLIVNDMARVTPWLGNVTHEEVRMALPRLGNMQQQLVWRVVGMQKTHVAVAEEMNIATNRAGRNVGYALAAMAHEIQRHRSRA